jgi:hypothetical protein
MKQLLVFLESKSLKTIRVREFPQRLELLRLEHVLQFVRHGHVGHAGNYTKLNRKHAAWIVPRMNS